ncbi:ferredoxin [Streptomyces erythrochromogenes]|uniref:ferredoxin n=1 Tax=Streptomyces erythrochromogenes TaxID=285574 RepID=UPI003694D039
MRPYWDPIPTARAMEGLPHPLWRGDAVSRDWSGPAPDGWEARDWRSVPGPFYAVNTDNCLTGRQCAPDHVMYEDRYGTEFVYRQPRTPEEVHALVCAAECEPLLGYGGDGDSHWTPDLVRYWWGERGRVREWAAALDRNWSVSDREDRREAAGGARAYVAHIDDGLAEYLRGYLFWLAERRPPTAGESLPNL